MLLNVIDHNNIPLKFIDQNKKSTKTQDSNVHS